MSAIEDRDLDPQGHDELEGGAMAHGATDEQQNDSAAYTDGSDHASIRDQSDAKAVLEALLFVSHEPVTIDRLAAAVESVPKSDVRQALLALQQECDEHRRGVQVVEVAGGFQLVTKPEYAIWIRRLGKSKAAPKLSRSGLESLAIIAYKQPIVRAEIEQIRGVETSGVLRTLLERKLVRIVGRKDVPGRPIMYGTTKYFLQHFGLRDLSELPPLREFKELGEAEQAMLPVGEDLMVVGGGEVAGEDVSLSDSMSAEPAEQP
ncbi:MAG: SMC-Scp complex subunit ScpB [Nitrospiraceae bacterium]